ncbi:uncharacterized protein Triagg1_77 [Trichoderma aggressivum f. europaeum]|uniref:Ankyrin repeat protein n=1 Tax=Trichoderma aggressivum f. europaeum TaxID=173218 RepID=A0AAE1M3N4_9HYPO|nr:hypothetical protein Triagg1_77 [Trichoderma aggressivum f. europaeum]
MAYNNNASGGSKQHNIGVQLSIFQKSIYNIFNEIPNALRTSMAVLLGRRSTDNVDLWICAYKLVQEREAKLMDDYTKFLDTLFVNGPPMPERDLLSPLYVKSIVSRLIEIREKDKFRVVLPRANSGVRQEIEKLAKFLVWSDTIVKTASKSQPHDALAWSGVSIFLSLLANTRTYSKTMLKGFNTLNDMQIFGKACEETYLTSSNLQLYNNLRYALAELYSYIIEYQARAICHIGHPSVSRAVQSVIGSDGWSEIIQPTQNIKRTCLEHIAQGQKEEIYLNSKNQLQAIQKQVILQEEILKDFKNNKQDEVERKFLEDFAQASGNYAGYKDINPERVPGTCEWFLADDRFSKWRASQTGELLWVSAGPGCGKSVLSRCLIDEGHLTPDSMITIESSTIKASQRESVICYFFFKEGGEGRMDGAHALCAILHQLFQHPLTANLITYALPSHRNNGKTLTEKMAELWQILIECAKFSSADIICVLDALDECRRESAHDLLLMVEKSYSQQGVLLKPSRLKFLITSRPYDDLKWSFDKLLSIATYLHFDGDEKSHQIGEEINLVIDFKIKNIASAFSDNERNTISERLKSMENRTYLWLHLTLAIIEKKRSAYGRSADIEEFLGKLPSNVADAYEKMLSQSQDNRKVEALLQIVLAARRPLTLVEANSALALAVEEGGFSTYAGLEEKLWPQGSFKATVQNLCGLFISIHDSKLFFIHLTAREFLVSREQPGKWKGRLTLSKSHGILSATCINYLQILNPSCKSPKDEYPLLSYAADFWDYHFRLQDAAPAEMLLKSARELCRTSSPQTQFWLKQRRGHHQAMSKTGPDLLLLIQLRLAAVVYYVLVHENVDVNARGLYVYKPLNIAIDNGDLDIMEILLDPAHGLKIERYDISMALNRYFDAEAMMNLLLDKRGSEIEIDDLFLCEVVNNRKCGAAMLAFLLKRRGDEIKITEEVVRRAARDGSAETMSLLLDELDNEFQITEAIMESVTHNERDVLALLLQRRGHEVKITEAILKEAMGTEYSETFDLILDHSNGIHITDEMVRAAAKNLFGGSEIMRLLFEKRGHSIAITEDMVKAAIGNEAYEPKIICLMLDRYGQKYNITRGIIKAAVGDRCHGLVITSMLLDKREHEFNATKYIVKAAVRNRQYGLEITSLLLNRRGHEFKITEDIVKAAAGNRGDVGPQIISLLLERRGHEFNITEYVIKAAVRNRRHGLEITSLLLNKRGHKFNITEDVVKAAVGNRRHGLEITSLLLNKRGHEFNITEDVVKAAVANENTEGVVSLLLDKRGHEINITEDIIKAAVGNRGDVGPQIISLLLDRRGHEFKITEDVVKAAVANEAEEIVSLLLDKRGHEFKITEDIIKTLAAAEHGNVLEMMSLLLDRRGAGNKINVTEGIIEATNKRHFYRDEMLALLQQKQGNLVNITEHQ